MWLLIGFPFGIYKIHLWLIPKNLDIGGTVGVWTMNIIIGCIMGGFVVIGYSSNVVPFLYVLVKGTRNKCLYPPIKGKYPICLSIASA